MHYDEANVFARHKWELTKSRQPFFDHGRRQPKTARLIFCQNALPRTNRPKKVIDVLLLLLFCTLLEMLREKTTAQVLHLKSYSECRCKWYWSVCFWTCRERHAYFLWFL